MKHKVVRCEIFLLKLKPIIRQSYNRQILSPKMFVVIRLSSTVTMLINSLQLSNACNRKFRGKMLESVENFHEKIESLLNLKRDFLVS